MENLIINISGGNGEGFGKDWIATGIVDYMRQSHNTFLVDMTKGEFPEEIYPPGTVVVVLDK